MPAWEGPGAAGNDLAGDRLVPACTLRAAYQRLLDRLLQLYYDAKRQAADGRLGAAGRAMRVCDLENRLYDLCRSHQGGPRPDMTPHERAFAKLVEEFVLLSAAGELFAFVLGPGVEPSNNLSERLLRGPARDRDAGRTNKKAHAVAALS